MSDISAVPSAIAGPKQDGDGGEPGVRARGANRLFGRGQIFPAVRADILAGLHFDQPRRGSPEFEGFMA